MNWTSLRSPAFLTASAVLVVALCGFRGVLHVFQWAVNKEAVPLRRSLEAIPDEVGGFRLERSLPRLTPELEAAYKTREYISRVYRDTARANAAVGATVWVHAAYFTGTPDTVIHVPEICYVAQGARGQDVGQATLEVPATGANPAVTVPIRVFQFVPAGGRAPERVAYFFVANGALVGMPEGVRALVFDLRDRKAYWCKVELMTDAAIPEPETRLLLSRFLAGFLPELRQCLPSRESVRW